MTPNRGAAAFTQAVRQLARDHASWVPTFCQLGRIQADLSLRCDRDRQAWPVGSYYILDYLVSPLDPIATTSSGGTPSHSHTVPRPSAFAPLAAGDRVLVALCTDGVDPVVIGRVRTGIPGGP